MWFQLNVKGEKGKGGEDKAPPHPFREQPPESGFHVFVFAFVLLLSYVFL